MSAIGKRLKESKKNYDANLSYSLEQAVDIVLNSPKAKFDETIDVVFNLNLDTKHADQMVRDKVILPFGTGKTVRVAVFAKGQFAVDAQNAGADIVGAEDLCDSIKSGKIDFDKCVATPDLMGLVGGVAKILGPKGLMPNPKIGTVTTDIKRTVEALKGGQVEFRADKFGIVHSIIGKKSFSKDRLVDNFKVLLNAIKQAKPSGAKGVYIKSVFISSTMGVGIKLDNIDNLV